MQDADVQRTDDPTKLEADAIVAAQAAFWLLTTTSNREDAISAAQFILTTRTQACAVAFEGSRAWQGIAPWACDAFNIWQSQPSEAGQEAVEILGLTLCHVAAQSSEVFVHRNDQPNPREHREIGRAPSHLRSDTGMELSVPAHQRAQNPARLDPSGRRSSLPSQRPQVLEAYLQENPRRARVRKSDSFGQTFLQALELARIAYSTGEPDSEEYVVRIAFIMTMITRGSALHNYRWTRPLQLLSTGKPSNAADALLELWAIAIERSNLQYTFWIQSSTLIGLLRLGDSMVRLQSSTFAEHLSDAICLSHDRLWSAHGDLRFELNIQQGYIACLRRTAQLAPDIPLTVQRKTVRGIEELIRSYIDPLIASESGGNSSEFIRLSSEAVVCLHTLSRQIRGSTKPFILRDSGSELLIGHLWIDAVVDILLKDRKRVGLRWTALYHPEDPTTSVGPSLIRILLWAYKRMRGSQISGTNKQQIFESSWRLWTPLAKEVASSKTRGLGESVGSFSPKDLDGITEFAQDIIQSHKKSAFIARNADVGINRLYAHFGRWADWEYELFDMSEQHAALCSRVSYVESGLM
ncbi:hypothetical protein FRC00_004057 [Tulasnella sp. 408]|nr:hypothetical protein FRC00_004057 [Tulasnella sp. 408]